MPFPNNTVRSYTEADILRLNPNQMGVYGIYRQGQWIYVGSGDIRDRMLAHVRGDNPRITAERPTNWLAEVTGDYLTREKALILELNPIANRRIG